MADEAGGLQDQAPARREMSAFGALQDKVPEDTAPKADVLAAPSADEEKPREAGRRRRAASRTTSSSDLLRSWSDISAAADAGQTASAATQAAEDERGRRKSSSISFGQDEVRVLSPSGRIVPETVQKLQQGIITAMQAKRTTLLKTFQFLNRAGRLRGVAKMEAVLAEMKALLSQSLSEEDTLQLLPSLIKSYDKDGNGSMSFGEFVTMCGGGSTRRVLRGGLPVSGAAIAADVAEALTGKFETVKQVFSVMDSDRSRSVSRQELAAACEKAGLPLAAEEAEALFAFVDTDKSGSITYDEVGKLMKMGAADAEENKAAAAHEAQQAQHILGLSRSIQEALANPSAMRRVIEASSTLFAPKPHHGPGAPPALNPDALVALQVPMGVNVGTDDVARVADVRSALTGPGALTAPVANAIISLAPKHVLAHGKLVIEEAASQAGSTSPRSTVVLDEAAAAEAGKYRECCIALLPQGGQEEERVVVEYTADRQVTVDSPLTALPDTETRYEVRDAERLSLVGMLLKTQAILEVRKAAAAHDDAKRSAAAKSASVASADMAQMVRALRRTKVASIKAAWDALNPMRTSSIGLTELAAGVERLGLVLHHPAAFEEWHVVEDKSGGKVNTKKVAEAQMQCYRQLFSRQSEVALLSHDASSSSGFTQRMSSFRDLISLTSGTVSRVGSSSSSSFDRQRSGSSDSSSGQLRGHVMGCMCEDQWVCEKCLTWNTQGGGYDGHAEDRARELRDCESQAKREKRAKKDLNVMPHITLVCTQTQIAKGLPKVTLDFIPTTWSWRQVRLELRSRLGRGVKLVFEGTMVDDEESWGKCVATLQDDWKHSKELLGQLDVDLIPVVCADPKCQQPAPGSCPNVGTPWRKGCTGQQWCPLAKWQLAQMMRTMDESMDSKIQYQEFAQALEPLWSLSAQQVDEAAADARMTFKGCLFQSFARVKIGPRAGLKWMWLIEGNGAESEAVLAFAHDLVDHGEPAPRGKLSLHHGVTVAHSDAEFDASSPNVTKSQQLGGLLFVVRAKDPAGKKVDTVWEVECESSLLCRRWLRALDSALSFRPKTAPMIQEKPVAKKPTLAQEAAPPPQLEAKISKEVSDAPIKPVTEAAPDTQIKPVTVVPTRIASTEKKVAKKKKKRTQDDGPPPAAGDLPARCWRVAGPYRGMCGDVHMMHRSFFDAIDMFPVALSSVKGRIAVQPNCDDSCCAVLHLHGGGGGATLSHRIARFCVHLSRTKQGPGEVSGRRGENERLFRLEAGPEFLISCYDQPFHCKLRKCSGVEESSHTGKWGRKHEHDSITIRAIESRGGREAESEHLELQVIGTSKAMVLRLLQDASKFMTEADSRGGVGAGTKGAAARDREKARGLMVQARYILSMGMPVAAKDIKKKDPGASGEGGAGIALLEWNPEGNCFHPPVRCEGLDKEMSLIQLLLLWVEINTGQSNEKTLNEGAKQRLSNESNLKLDAKGLSLKERQALKKYHVDLKQVHDVLREINSLALLCPMFVSMGAWLDLVNALQRIVRGLRRVTSGNFSDATEQSTGEADKEKRDGTKIQNDSVLSSGKNAILKRRHFDLSDIISDAEAFGVKVAALLGPDFAPSTDEVGVVINDESKISVAADSWLGRNAAALAVLAQAITLPHFPASKIPGAIPIVRSMPVLNWQLEDCDPMQINELTVHVLALRLPAHIRAVYLTIDFYSLPRVRSEVLTLSAPKADGLRSLQSYGTGLAPLIPHGLSPASGNSIRLKATPEMSGSNRHSDFAHYLCEHDLDIDVWDAESCLSLGTLRVSNLARLLRQGQSAVQTVDTLPFAADADASGERPVLCRSSGKELHLSSALSSGSPQSGALVRMVNRGIIPQSAIPGAGEVDLEGDVVKSWRLSDPGQRQNASDGSDGLTAASSKRKGMEAIMYARKYGVAKNSGRIADGSVVAIDMTEMPAAEAHASALRSYRLKKAYQLQGMQSIIEKYSVKHVEMRPMYGQTDFTFAHAIDNPHDHVVVCMASITAIDVEQVAMEKRYHVVQGLQITGGVLQPTQSNDDAPPQAQSWLLQPSAQVSLIVRVENKPEHWQLNPYVATVRITRMRESQVSSQFDLRITVRPLPPVFDRHLRFFVDGDQFKHQFHVPYPEHIQLQANEYLTVRTVPEGGVNANIGLPPKCPSKKHAMIISTGKANDVQYQCQTKVHMNDTWEWNCKRKSGERWHCPLCQEDFCFECKDRQIVCNLTVNMKHEVILRLNRPNTDALHGDLVPGWEKQQSCAIHLMLTDASGSIRQRWKIELVSVIGAMTDARRKNVQIHLVPSIQDRLLSCHRQFYSSNSELMPSFRKNAASAPADDLEVEEESPLTYKLGRGFGDIKSSEYLVLVTQDTNRRRVLREHGLFFGDSELVVDDAHSVMMSRCTTVIEDVLRHLGQSGKAACSESQLQAIKQSGVLAIKEVAPVASRGSGAVADLTEMLRLLRQAKASYRSRTRITREEDQPITLRDLCPFQRPRDALFLSTSPNDGSALHSKDKRSVSKVEQVRNAEAICVAVPVRFGTVVAAWRVRAFGSNTQQASSEEEEEEELEEEEGVRRRTGPKPVIRFECGYHLFPLPKGRDSEDAKAKALQAEALEKHVYKGDHSLAVQQYFSPFERTQVLIERYPDLTAEDRPAGPFLAATMGESRIFFLADPEGEGKGGMLSRDDILNSLTHVAWSFQWNMGGHYDMKAQGLVYQRQKQVKVPYSVADTIKLGKEAGGATLLAPDGYCRARKKALATFCKLHSWGLVGKDPQLYYGRGVSRDEVRDLRAAASSALQGQGPGVVEDLVLRTDDQVVEPIECIIVTGAALHLDMEHFEYKDFVLDCNRHAKRVPLAASVRFPHLYRHCSVKDETGALFLPGYKEAKSMKKLGFTSIPPAGHKIKGRRVRIFSEDLRRHGWNTCVVLDYSQGSDGLWRHKVQFDDGKIEELMLDGMSSAVKELVADAKKPDEDVLLNTKALLSSLVEDLSLVLAAFAEMVDVFNDRVKCTPKVSGFLKLTALPYLLRYAPGARQMMSSIVEPILQEALLIALLEDKGGFAKEISAVEVPLGWKGSFPPRISTLHANRADTIQELFASGTADNFAPKTSDHVIEVCFGSIEDILIFAPEDLWSGNGMRLPGVVAYSSALALPYSARHTGWAAEDCVESFVGDHTDVRLLQNFWFNKTLLDDSRFKKVDLPQSVHLGLTMADLREAYDLFRLIDQDNSKTLETHECSSYLENMGYLDEQINDFFAACDENNDGVITWNEFILGASQLYKPPKPKTDKKILGAAPAKVLVTCDIATSPLTIEIHSGMTWAEVQALTVSAFEAASGKPMLASATTTQSIFFEYTNVRAAREVVSQAIEYFEQMDLDNGGELDRDELVKRLCLPTDVGGFGYHEYQVDDFIKDADSDGNGTVDREEFVRAAARYLLADEGPRTDNHWLSGLRLGNAWRAVAANTAASQYNKAKLRLRCREEKEWVEMRANIFPTMEQRRDELIVLRRRLYMPTDTDESENAHKAAKSEKHMVQRKLRQAEDELKSFESQRDKLVASLHVEWDTSKKSWKFPADSKLSEDARKGEVNKLENLKRKEQAVKEIISKLKIALKDKSEKEDHARRELVEVEARRRSKFVENRLNTLKRAREDELKALCIKVKHGEACQHKEHYGKEDIIKKLVEDEYLYEKEQLQEKTEQFEEEERLANAPITADIDVRLHQSFKYNLRCLLHRDMKITTEAASEWKEIKDKRDDTEQVSWLNVYSGERRVTKPNARGVLLNTSTKRQPSFLRHFKEWKRTGVVLPVSDSTTWTEMRQVHLLNLLQERFQLVSRVWVTVRNEDDWEDMKANLHEWSQTQTRVIVAREPPQKKAKSLPAGWEAYNIIPSGWQRQYDDGKFVFVRTSDSKAEKQTAFPMDCLDDIVWPDDSVSSGKDVAAELGTPPDSDSFNGLVYINKKAQLIAWQAPKATKDICAVRVRLADSKKEEKPPSTIAKLKELEPPIKDDFVPIVLMEGPSAAAKEKVSKDGKALPALQMLYKVVEGGPLGGFLLIPTVEWKDMLSILKDKVEPKGKERIFDYDYQRYRPTDPLVSVRSQREWDLFVQKHMLELRAQVVSRYTHSLSKSGATASGTAAPVGGDANLLRMRIFVRDLQEIKMQVLDSLPSDEANQLPNLGTELVDGASFEVRDELPIKLNTSFDMLVAELKDTCKAPCVFRYHQPRRIMSDGTWLSTLEQIYAIKSAHDGPRQVVSLAKKEPGKVLAEITLSFDEPALEIVADQSTEWLLILAELRRATGSTSVGVMHGGDTVREDRAYKQLLQRELLDKHVSSNLKTVDRAVLIALQKHWKEDSKSGPMAVELQRRRNQQDEVSDGDKTLKLKLVSCAVVHDQGDSGRMLLQGELDVGLRRFRLTCRQARPPEALALAAVRTDKKGDKGPSKESKKKKASSGKTESAEEAPLVMEVMRRTRKGREKIKGLLLLRARGEQIFALSPDDVDDLGGQRLRRGLSCCPRHSQGVHCCEGLVWDARNTILHTAVDVTDEHNIFCYNGPTVAKIKGGTFTLVQLAAALRHAVLGATVSTRVPISRCS